MHRPNMDWTAAGRRGDPDTIEGRLWHGLRRLIAMRGATRALHGEGRSEPQWTGNEHVFALLREHAGQSLRLVANFHHDAQAVAMDAPDEAAAVDGRPIAREHGRIVLAPYQHLWIRS